MNLQQAHELFSWLQQSKKLADDKLITESESNKLIKSNISKFTDLGQKIEFLNLMKFDSKVAYQIDFWTIQFIKNDLDTIDALKLMMQRGSHNGNLSENFLTLLAEKFVKLPPKTRKEFYLENFTVLKESNYTNNKLVNICGVSKSLWPNDFHHNLPSLILENYKLQDKPYVVKQIIQDNKELLSEDQYNRLVLPSIIMYSSLSEVTKNWEHWNMQYNDTYKHILALKLLKRTNKLNDELFINTIKKTEVPYNIQLANGAYLMSLYINNIASTVRSVLSSITKDSKDIESIITLQSKKLREVQEYDLSFVNKKSLLEALKPIKESYIPSDKVDAPEIRKAVLEFSLALSDMEKEEKKIEKKMKV